MPVDPIVKDYLVTIGSKGGRKKSARKSEQARINGARNTGRKKKKIIVDEPKPLS